MKLLRNILIGILILIAVFVLTGFLLPKEMVFQRSIIVNANKAEVFGLISDFGHFNEFSPWFAMDTLQKTSVSGTPGEPGYRYEWESTNTDVGKGRLTRISTVPNDSVINELDLISFNMKSRDEWILEDTAGMVKVTWRYSGSSGNNIILRYLSLLIDGMMGPVFNSGLDRLKTRSEMLHAYGHKD
jgi:hypothetical protein